MSACMDKQYDLSDLLSEAMRELGMTQAELARQSRVSKQTVSDYINRKRAYPDPESLAKLARVLKLPVETVYQAAGIPTSNLSERESRLLELDHIFSNATDQQREEILRYARYLMQTTPSAARLNPKTQPR